MHGYLVKVRGKSYLWGSSGITSDLTWPLLLVLNNDLLGDPINLGSDSSNGESSLGTLQPGECWTIPLKGLRGVHAVCETDTTVICTLLLPKLPDS